MILGERLWSFETKNFEVFCDASEVAQPDLSWTAADKTDTGEFIAIDWHRRSSPSVMG